MQASTIAIGNNAAIVRQVRARARVAARIAARVAARRPTVARATKPVMAGQVQASPFEAVDSEEALFSILKAGAGSGKIPSRLIGAVSELYSNYKAAIMGSGLEGADEVFVARVMASVCERVLLQLNPIAAYTFPSFHERILEPYNYYNFGQRYIRGLIDFSTSMLGNEAGFEEIEQQLKNGENVVLLANHQTEVRNHDITNRLPADRPSDRPADLRFPLSSSRRIRPCLPSYSRLDSLAWPPTSYTSQGTGSSRTRCASPSPWDAICSACTPRSTWVTTRRSRLRRWQRIGGLCVPCKMH